MKEGEPQKKSCGSCRERNGSRKMQDAQVQVEMDGRRATDCPVEKRCCVSRGTQTVKGGEKTSGSSVTHADQTRPATREPASSVTQSLDFSITLQPQNITLGKHLYSTCLPPVPNVPTGTPSDGESSLDRSSDSVTNLASTSTRSSDVMTVPISLKDDSNSSAPQEDSSCQQSSEFEERIGMGLRDEKTKFKMADKRENREQPSQANRDEMLGEEKGNPTEKKHVHVGMKSLTKMKQMQQTFETTKISVKVKLRRRTKGEEWEVVSVQDADETLSVHTSLKQTDLTNSQLSSVQPGLFHKPETSVVQPATASSPEPAPPYTSSDSQLGCGDCFTPNQNDELDSPGQPPGPSEESDEQIEKLLEDVMMGLNILPNLEKDCKQPHLLQPSLRENERVHAAVSAAGCVYHPDFGTRIGHSSTDSGIHCCSTTQKQPSSSSLSSLQSNAIQQQQSSHYNSPATSVGHRDGTSHQCMPLSESQKCLYCAAPTTGSVIATAFHSSVQELQSPVGQELSSQDHQNILELLPLMNGSDTQSSQCFSLPSLDDFQLPPCLSPLEPFTSAAKYQPVLNNSNHSDKIQPQPSLHRRPWLIEKPGSLKFPLDAVPHRQSMSLPWDTNQNCWSMPEQKHLDLNSPQNRGTRAKFYTVKEVEKGGTICVDHVNAPEVKSEHSKMKKSCKRCKQGDTKGDTAAAKRGTKKCTSHPQDAADSLLTNKHFDVSDGVKSQINLGICSVSLSSNNVLAKEREMSTSASKVPNKFSGRPDEPARLQNEQTRIRTRGFLKKTQETTSNASLENSSVFKPLAHSAKIVNKQGVSLPKRKRGRPAKEKLEERPLAITDKKSNGVGSEQQVDNNLPKEEEEGEKTKGRCKKRGRNRNEVKVIPLKMSTSAAKAEADGNDDVIPGVRKLGTPKRPRMDTVKELQKLIKCQHSKVRNAKESQDKEPNETAKDLDSEEKECGSRREEIITETEVDIDITQPQNRERTEESRIVFNVTVDENYNQIFSKSAAEYSKSRRDDAVSFVSEESSLFGVEHRLVFSCDVLEEEIKLAAEREQPLQKPHEACVAGISDQTAISDEGSSQSNAHTLLRGDKMTNPQTPERTGLSDAVGFIKSSDSHQKEGEEKEEEEEVEVDILLYSPDKVPQSRECKNGQDNMDITPEEEEEEDVTEIDVTGDEAE
nr:uncharacterized protein LOC124066727 isoform X2 [Scatophagus argus]